MSDNIIYRCWQRTGIIPEDDNMLIDAEEDIENTIQSLINQTDAAQLNAEDYINIDSSLEESDINDDEIIALVQETAEEECDSNDDLSLLPLSSKTALESVENILRYLQQQNDFSIDCSLVLKIRDLQNQIRKKQINSMKQTTLDSFFAN